MSAVLGRPWTATEDAAIRAGYLKRGAAALARELNRSFSAVAHRARRLGIQSHRRWTKADADFLADYWGHMTLSQLSKEMGRTTAAIYQRANETGLELGVPEGYEY